MRTLLFSLVLALPALFAETPKAPPKTVGTTPPTSDSQLESTIRSRFAASKIAKNNFHVSVKNGVATLTGATDVIQHKGTATRIAKAAGARAVENRIQVSEAARQRAGQKLARARKAGVRQN